MTYTRLLFLLAIGISLWLTAFTCTAHGQECGDNPMNKIVMVAKKSKRSLTHVLSILREIDADAYENLARKFHSYAACVGLVDTAYFKKKRSLPWSPTVSSSPKFRQPLADLYDMSDDLDDAAKIWSENQPTKPGRTYNKRLFLFPENSHFEKRFSNDDDVENELTEDRSFFSNYGGVASSILVMHASMW